jgi:hypothetical protein
MNAVDDHDSRRASVQPDTRQFKVLPERLDRSCVRSRDEQLVGKPELIQLAE